MHMKNMKTIGMKSMNRMTKSSDMRLRVRGSVLGLVGTAGLGTREPTAPLPTRNNETGLDRTGSVPCFSCAPTVRTLHPISPARKRASIGAIRKYKSGTISVSVASPVRSMVSDQTYCFMAPAAVWEPCLEPKCSACIHMSLQSESGVR